MNALRAILLVIACVSPASAQAPLAPAPGPAFARFRPAPTLPPARPASFIGRAPDYRWEGLAIGGIVGGLYFGIAARSLCDGGSCITGTLYFAALGGAAGGLFGCFVGMFIPKSHAASTH
jgi:predicted lipid-binding transport protein (Tim44 family)